MNIPNKIVAGDTATWSDDPVVLSGSGLAISSADHTLSYSFRGSIAGAGVDIASSASGAGWSTTLSGVQTSAFNPAPAVTPLIWYWQAYATAIVGGARLMIGEGQVQIKPNLAAITGTNTYDGRSQSEKDLAAVVSEISARANGGMTIEYTIGSRSLKKESITQLIILETKLRNQVSREKNAQAIANGLGSPGKTLVRFS